MSAQGREGGYVNTFEQLVAAGGGVAIGTAYAPGRQQYACGWRVWRVVNGRSVRTDDRKDAPWYYHGDRVFSYGFGTDKATALAQARAWVKDQGWYDGPWVRNRFGDWLPTDIHKRFPLQPRERKAGVR